MATAPGRFAENYSRGQTWSETITVPSDHGIRILFGDVTFDDKTDAVNDAAPPPLATTRPFGVAPAGITTPAMGEASVLEPKVVLSFSSVGCMPWVVRSS